MARPPLFTDQQIIAIGEKLRAKGPVTATLLWEACGRRGRLNRYQTIWNRHEVEQRHAAAEGPSAGVLITLPEKAQCLATALKADLSAGIDRVTSSIYLATEDAQRGRFQAELADMNAARDAYRREIEDAFAALEEVSEALAESQERVGQLEVTLAATLTQRDINEALRGAVAQQQAGTLARLRDVESELKAEALSSAALRVELVRAEMAREAADRALLDSTAALNEARQTIVETSPSPASIGEIDGSQAAAILLKDAENTGRRTEATQEVLPERAEKTVRQDVAPRPSPGSVTIETLSDGHVQHRRRGPGTKQHVALDDADASDRFATAVLSSDEQQASALMAGRQP